MGSDSACSVVNRGVVHVFTIVIGPWETVEQVNRHVTIITLVKCH